MGSGELRSIGGRSVLVPSFLPRLLATTPSAHRQPFARPETCWRVATSRAVHRTKSGYRIVRGTVLPRGARLRGDEALIIERGALIRGGVFTGGTIYAQPNVVVHGPMRAFGDVVVGAFGQVGGDIQGRGDVRLLPGCRVLGDIDAVGDVHMFEGTVIRGRVKAGGDIVVCGNVKAAGIIPGGRVRTESFQIARAQRGSGPDAPAGPTPSPQSMPDLGGDEMLRDDPDA